MPSSALKSKRLKNGAFPQQPPQRTNTSNQEHYRQDRGSSLVRRRDRAPLDGDGLHAGVGVALARAARGVRDRYSLFLVDQEGRQGAQDAHLVAGRREAVVDARRPVEPAHAAVVAARALLHGRLRRRLERVHHLGPDERRQLRRRRQPPVDEALEGDRVERAPGPLAYGLERHPVGEEYLDGLVQELVDPVLPYIVFGLFRGKHRGLVNWTAGQALILSPKHVFQLFEFPPPTETNLHSHTYERLLRVTLLRCRSIVAY